MSVLISDIRVYGAADMPEADGNTVGGAIDFTKRIEFGVPLGSPPFTATTHQTVSSSASDTATKITFSGRDSTGVIHSETLALNGQTKVTSANSYERLLSALASGAASAFGLSTPGGTQAVGDIALISSTAAASGTAQNAANATSSTPAYIELQSGQGADVQAGMVIQITNNTPTGAEYQLRRILAVNPGGLGADYVAVDRNWGTVPTSGTTYSVYPGMHFELAGSSGGTALSGTATQVLGVTRLFVGSAADVAGGSNRTYYEKVFVNNNNEATALTGATVEIAGDSPALPPGAALDVGLPSALDDTATIANRQTAPAAVTFTVQPATVAVPGGNLPASAGAGSAAGSLAVWLRLDLAAGSAAYEGSPGASLQTQGSST
ncbi:MAG TPA: hypothetical protein VME41_13485 [Stellaceae bacterium]|nr:hypothetical protein [Stellaceae bacterium]